MITNKITAYGLTVAVAFAAAVVLLLASAPSSVSADKATTANASQTIVSGSATTIVLTATQPSGKEVCEEGTFTQAAVVGGTLSGEVENGCVNKSTTLSSNAALADTTLSVASTAGFPDSGSLIIDQTDDGDIATNVAIEVVDYTGKTATSFTGVGRAKASTVATAPASGSRVHLVTYSTVTVVALDGIVTSINLADASSFVTATGGPEVLIDPIGGSQQVIAVTSKSGNTLVGAAAPAAEPIGTYVVQIVTPNTDSADVNFTPTTGATEGSFTYQHTALTQASTSGTVSLTVIADKPTASDVEATAGVTLPTPLPVIITLSGSDTTEVANTSSWVFSALPTKGILTLTPAPAATCTNVVSTPAAKVGEVLTNCTGQVVYTPLLGATGNDSFQYSLRNGAVPTSSDAATVTIVLPGGSGTVTPGAGFSTPIVAGFNISQYNGGTVAEMAADAAASGATTVSVTVAGGFLTYVVGAPTFVNAAFTANFPDGIPAATGVLVIVRS